MATTSIEMSSFKYYIINKPFGVLSQFTPEHGNQCLGDFFQIEKDVYPLGRLDKESEGLLILTNDKSLNQKVLHPSQKMSKTYWAQVEKTITKDAIQLLQEGVIIKVNKRDHFTNPAIVNSMEEPTLWERVPPIRFRKNVSTSWLELKISEGKNRQVRKMTAKVGFPTLRLIRAEIGNLSLGELQSGEIKEMTKDEIYNQLGIRK